jgi:hypothetical protein
MAPPFAPGSPNAATAASPTTREKDREIGDLVPGRHAQLTQAIWKSPMPAWGSGGGPERRTRVALLRLRRDQAQGTFPHTRPCNAHSSFALWLDSSDIRARSRTTQTRGSAGCEIDRLAGTRARREPGESDWRPVIEPAGERVSRPSRANDERTGHERDHPLLVVRH